MNTQTKQEDIGQDNTSPPFYPLGDEQLALNKHIEAWGKTLSTFPLNRLLQVEILRDSPIEMLNEAGEEIVKAKERVGQTLHPFVEESNPNLEGIRKLHKDLDQIFQDLYSGFYAKAEDALNRIVPSDIIDLSVVAQFRDFYLSESQNIPASLRVVVPKSNGDNAASGSQIADFDESSLNGNSQKSGLLVFRDLGYFFYRMQLRRKYRVIRIPLRSIIQSALLLQEGLGLENLITRYESQHEQALSNLKNRWITVRSGFVSALAEVSEGARSAERDIFKEIDFGRIDHNLAVALDEAYEDFDSLVSHYRSIRKELPQAVNESHENLLDFICESIANEAKPVSAFGQIGKRYASSVRNFNSYTSNGSSKSVTYWKWIRESAVPQAVIFITRVRSTLALTAKPQEKLLALADLPDYKDVLRDAYKTFPILGEVYSPEPLSTMEFVISRGAEIDTITEAVSRWQYGYLSSVAVVGAQGSGKTTILNSFLHQVDPSIHITRLEIKSRLRTEKDVLTFLQSVFNITEQSESLDQLIDHLLQLPRQAIILEGGHNIMLRAVGGRRAVQAFLYVIMATRSQLLWIVSCREFPWNQLDYIVGIGQYFTHEAHIERTDSRNLRDVIMKRWEAVDLPLVFLDEEVGNRGLFTFGSTADEPDSETQLELQEKYFNDLSGLTGGNIQAALYFWLSSLSYDETNHRIIVAPCMKMSARAIEGLDRLYLFTLAELLKHGELTPMEHSEIFMMDETKSRLTLNYLVQLRLVDPLKTDANARPYAYEISNVLIHIIASSLRSMNILY